MRTIGLNAAAAVSLDRECTASAGFHVHLVKPESAEQLLAEVAKALALLEGAERRWAAPSKGKPDAHKVKPLHDPAQVGASR